MPGRENWWVQPAIYATVLSAFVIYSFWSVVFGASGGGWHAGPYLSPFYSPLIKFGWWHNIGPFVLSSAILVAWVPLGFRASCYYYRKAYYRSFFWDPPACAIREPQHGRYTGERRFPFVINNYHRYFLYLSIIVLGFLWWDTISSFTYRGTWYVGFGSIVMLVNVVALTLYTSSCHALRHLVGGSVDCYSCTFAGNTRHGLWALVSKVNPLHGNFAWASLVIVGLTDVYIRVVASGALGSCFGPHTGC